ncbi:PREDICTED: clarin-3 [Ceratotherium simum simum]|uniref:Clarin-3 n=1 Tax=Ceratotherium simum simum TaxID=73337 RepID=A0ABM0I2J8_CERSS|nr:PREDICTED: clarin-3 [Ceratotherium simum simum]
MPTIKKILMFLSGFITSLGSLIVICSVLGTREWMSSTIAISEPSSNGSLVITYGLFRGNSFQELDQGLAEPSKEFGVIGQLNNSSQKSLHLAVMLFLVLSLLTSLLSCVFTLYNSISNPYQTFLGPVGVYTWSGLSALLTFVSMMLFVGNIQSNHLSEELAQVLYPLYPRTAYKGTSHSYGYSFWLLLLIILLNIVTVVIIIFYQRSRRQRKQEQRKLTEHAPRDGILF